MFKRKTDTIEYSEFQPVKITENQHIKKKI